MQQYKTAEEFLNALTPKRREQVNEIRAIIMMSEPALTEHIKWNAPSYVYEGEDRITFNAHGDKIRLLIHMGVTYKEDKEATPILHDDSGMIVWNSNIRGIITFESIDDVRAKQDKLSSILKRWLALTKNVST